MGLINYLFSINTLGVICGQVFIPAFNFFLSVIVVWILGSERSNVFMLLYSMALTVAVFSDFGMRNTLYCEVGQLGGGELSSYLSKIYGYKFALSLVTTICFFYFLYFIAHYDFAISLLFPLIAINLYVADPSIQILRGKVLAQFEIALSMLDKGGLLLILVLYWWAGGTNISIVLGSYVFVSLLRMALGFYYVRHYVAKFTPAFFNVSHFIFVKKKFMPGLILLVYIFYLKLPILLTSFLKIENFSAIVTIILTILQATLLVPSIFTNSILPRITGTISSPDTDFRQHHKNILFISMVMTLLTGILLTLLVSFFAKDMLAMFHADYIKFTQLLLIGSWAIPFICSNQLVRMIAISRGLYSVVLFMMLATTLLVFIISSVMVPDMGIYGLIYAYVAGEISLFIMFLFVFIIFNIHILCTI